MTSRRFTDGEICHVHTGSPDNGEIVLVTCQPAGPTHARYVYIYLPGEKRILSLCEVEVYEFTGKLCPRYIIATSYISKSDANNNCNKIHHRHFLPIYRSRLLHWHLGNHATALEAANEPWLFT